VSDLPQALVRNPRLESWIRVESDGRVTVFTGKAELGQGILSAVARIAAEELDVELDQIVVRSADSSESPNEFITAGSGSVEGSGGALRVAAAEARLQLVERAAERLGVSPDSLHTDAGRVLGLDVALSYAELCADAPLTGEISGRAEPKPTDRYRVVGRSGPRVGMRELATGSPWFVQDLELPGMTHARVVRPPAPGSTLQSVDVDGPRNLPGVLQVVRDGRFLAVIAEREEQAEAAAEALRAASQWNPGPALAPEAGVFAELRRPDASLLVVDGTPEPDATIPAVADADQLRALGAVHTVSASYEKPYHLHASLGPSCAVALCEDGDLTVWSHSQGVAILQHSLAQALELPAERVRVIHKPGAGCYGHNGADDVAFDAALLACELPGRPVRVQWSRDDEQGWEPCSPATVVDLQASVDAGGRIVDWNHDVYSTTHMGRPLPGRGHSGLLGSWHRESARTPPEPKPGLAPHGGIHRNADPLYDLPRRRIVKHFKASGPLRTSSTRGLGAYANVFAIESFLDELARAADLDAVALRLQHLADPRARAVIEAAIARCDPRETGAATDAHTPRGRGLGFARYKNEKTYCAVIVEVAVERATGRVRLERAVVAADAGRVIDPDGLANQLEGGLIQSASWTLCEEVHFDSARVSTRDLESYPTLGFLAAPEVEAVLLDRPDEAPLGAGEAAHGPTPAAIANAIFAATGVRLRRVPFTPERMLAAFEGAGTRTGG